jgi:2-pyrone-4,6-dicarboxylate lactonase
MREHPNVWSKVSCPERLSLTGPKALNGEQAPTATWCPSPASMVEEFPDRVLWGTDWPHPNLKDHMPDDGLLVDFIPHIAPTAELQKKLLVDNPMRCTGRTRPCWTAPPRWRPVPSRPTAMRSQRTAWSRAG